MRRSNIFIDLLYERDYCTTFINRIKFHFKMKKIKNQYKKTPPDFDTLLQFALFLKWIDIIYGLDEEKNSDIDLSKSKYFTNKDSVVSFAINSDKRSKINFDLILDSKMINITVNRKGTLYSEKKESVIEIDSTLSTFEFSKEDILMINEINRILQKTIVKYISEVIG